MIAGAPPAKGAARQTSPPTAQILAAEGIADYTQDLGQLSAAERQTNGTVILFAEKDGRFAPVREIAQAYDATALALGGYPSSLATEYLVQALQQAGVLAERPALQLFTGSAPCWRRRRAGASTRSPWRRWWRRSPPWRLGSCWRWRATSGRGSPQAGRFQRLRWWSASCR